jgi:spore maturation protein CgeB
MLTEKNKGKITHFYKVLSLVQPSAGKDIGLILIKDETLADLISLCENSNLTAVFELTEDTYVQGFLEELAEALKRGLTVFIRLHQYLDPAIYNQLYLISHAGRMHFFKLEDEILVNVPKEARLILVSTDEEIEKLNYKNLFEIVGPILRLE